MDDWKDGFYVIVPFYISTEKNMNDQDKLVFGALYGNIGKFSRSSLNAEHIAEALNMHKDTVEQSLSCLKDAGYITEEEGYTKILLNKSRDGK